MYDRAVFGDNVGFAVLRKPLGLSIEKLIVLGDGNGVGEDVQKVCELGVLDADHTAGLAVDVESDDERVPATEDGDVGEGVAEGEEFHGRVRTSTIPRGFLPVAWISSMMSMTSSALYVVLQTEHVMPGQSLPSGLPQQCGVG